MTSTSVGRMHALCSHDNPFLVLTTTSSENTRPQNIRILINRWGGFPILHCDALAWANRIRKEDGRRLLTNDPRDSGSTFATLEPIVQAAGGVDCYPHNGPTEPGKPYDSGLILTQYEEGEWRAIDGVLELGSYLVEGEREAVGKEPLKREGKPRFYFCAYFITHSPLILSPRNSFGAFWNMLLEFLTYYVRI